VLWVGRLEPVKQPELAIDVFRQLARRNAGLTFVIIGDGSLREAVRAGAGEIGDRLRLVGAVAPDEMPAWFAASDVLLITSRSESGPMVAKEAIASGMPVVGTDVGILAELESQGLGVTVAGHEPVSVLVTLVREPGDVVVDLGLESNSQQPARALTDDLIKPDTHLRAGIVICYYSQHRRSFLPGLHPRSSSYWFQRGRYAAPSNGWSIHKFWL